MTIQDDFKAEIEAFLDRHDMKPAAFGAQALHDPKFVFDLRAGRSPSVKTIEKVRTWMAEQDAAAENPEDANPGAPDSEETTTAAGDSAPSAPAKAAPAAEQAAEETPRPPPSGKRRGRRGALVTILLLLVIAAGAVALWKPRAVQTAATGLYNRIVDDGGAVAGGNPDIEQFSAVVAAVQDDFNTLRQDIDRLDRRTDALEDRVAEDGGPPVESGRITALEERIQALEDRPAPVGDSGPDPALANRLDEVESRLAREEEAASAVTPQDLDSLSGRLDRLRQTVDRLQTRQEDLAALEEDIAALSERVEAVATGMNDMSGLQAGIERSAMISAFMRLDADVRSGRPYAASLTLYQRQRDLQAGDWPSAEALAGAAESGIATRESLEQRLDGLIPPILSGQEEGDNWTERLWSRLSGIVVVRRTGEPEGDAPEAIVARTETRLAAGDLAGAVAELESLPGSRRAMAEDWLADARARLEALETLSGMADALGNGDTDGS